MLDDFEFGQYNDPNIFPGAPEPVIPVPPTPGQKPPSDGTKGNLPPFPPEEDSGLEWPTFSFTMPEMPDYAAMYEEMQAKADEAAGIRDRDAAYGQYLDAANDAVSYIDADIGQKQARANLMGVDYFVSDEDRAVKVKDYFASIWSEGSQKQLDDLMSKWGNPEGFEGFTLERGDATTYTQVQEAEITPISRTGKGILPSKKSLSNGILSDINDESDQINILGV